MNIKIVATGVGIPQKVIRNRDICTTADECNRIEALTGIQERRRADDSDSTSTLAAQAAEAALTASGIMPEEIGLIILSTTSPDMFVPSTACLVQGRIGAKNAAAFDISASCSGFIYSLHTAKAFFSAQHKSKILVISAEIKSRFLNKTDFDTYPLFGDGAAAVVLAGTEHANEGIIDICAGADGSKTDLINLKIDRKAINKDPAKNRPCIRMAGARLFRSAVNTLSDSTSNMLIKHSLSVNDIDHFIFHQANIRILTAVAKRLSIPINKIRKSIDKFGNTSSASIPITLHQSIKEGKIKKGDLLLLASFGGGITWATALLRL